MPSRRKQDQKASASVKAAAQAMNGMLAERAPSLVLRLGRDEFDLIKERVISMGAALAEGSVGPAEAKDALRHISSFFAFAAARFDKLNPARAKALQGITTIALPTYLAEIGRPDLRNLLARFMDSPHAAAELGDWSASEMVSTDAGSATILGVSERQLSDLSETPIPEEQHLTESDLMVLQGLALGLIDGTSDTTYLDYLTPVELSVLQHYLNVVHQEPPEFFQSSHFSRIPVIIETVQQAYLGRPT